MTLRNQRQCTVDDCVPVSTLSERMESYKTNCDTKMTGFNGSLGVVRKLMMGLLAVCFLAASTSAVAQWKSQYALTAVEKNRATVAEMSKQLSEIHGFLMSKDKRIAVTAVMPSSEDQGVRRDNATNTTL